MNTIIAIDGPAGSGKGTIANILAKQYNLINIDTGATYRCVALEVIRNKINYQDQKKVGVISKNIKIAFDKDNRVYLNDEDVSDLIRSKEVTNIVSQVSSNITVRENMVELQRKLALNNNVILEGRDITTVVFPNANYKFYLDASIEVRANRRYKECLEKNINMTYEEIIENIRKRDYNDMNKAVGALKRTDEQIYIDTTNLSIEEVVSKMKKFIDGGNK